MDIIKWQLNFGSCNSRSVQSPLYIGDSKKAIKLSELIKAKEIVHVQHYSKKKNNRANCHQFNAFRYIRNGKILTQECVTLVEMRQ